MTLQVVFDKEKMRSILGVMPDVFSVWKVVLDNPVDGCFVAPYIGSRYESGEQEAKTINHWSSANPDYELFYHFWVNKTFVMERLNNFLEWYVSESRKGLACLNRIFNMCGINDLRYNSNYMVNPRVLYSDTLRELEHYMNTVKEGIPRVISCVVRKEDVTTIGKQDDGLAVVCRKAIFPQYPHNKVPDDWRIALFGPLEPVPVKKGELVDSMATITSVRGYDIEPMESSEKAMALC